MSVLACGGAALRIAVDDIELECDEASIYTSRLPLAGSRILELGCGAAQHTVAIAGLDAGISITALEVDPIQHEKNLNAIGLSNVTFKLAGAEAIPEPDASFDVVMMFKSLHHVPIDSLGQALREIRRVLKPGGWLYISEPIFAGAFNDILRLFHDEEEVRRAAFEAIGAAVDEGLFDVVEEIFFKAPVKFADFTDFENKIIRATHSDHQMPGDVYAQVKARMEANKGEAGICFSAPMRIDILRVAAT